MDGLDWLKDKNITEEKIEKVKTGNELIRLCIIHNIYTPRTNEEIELEKQDLLLTKKLRKQYRLKQNNF
jgi:hypothetical protein